MQIARTIESLKKSFNAGSDGRHGFVPTMGALHDGHLSLVKMAVDECRHVTVSIFVNPTQFNDKEDLKNYPRNEKNDLELLLTVLRESDTVFIPEVDEMYPSHDTRIFDFGRLASVMEGAHRPGHFNGVAQIVSKLFDIVEPDVAYFGQKDFQQLAVIRELERQRGNRVKITGCPVVREPDGLAMSSRNMLLSALHREKAPVIYRTLKIASEFGRKKEIGEIRKFVFETIDSTEGFSTEYFEIADELTLEPLTSPDKIIPGRRYFGCIAVRAGKVRLIDNIEFHIH